MNKRHLLQKCRRGNKDLAHNMVNREVVVKGDYISLVVDKVEVVVEVVDINKEETEEDTISQVKL